MRLEMRRLQTRRKEILENARHPVQGPSLQRYTDGCSSGTYISLASLFHIVEARAQLKDFPAHSSIEYTYAKGEMWCTSRCKTFAYTFSTTLICQHCACLAARCSPEASAETACKVKTSRKVLPEITKVARDTFASVVFAALATPLQPHGRIAWGHVNV